MSEYIVCEGIESTVADYLGVKHTVNHYEKREEITRCRDCENYLYREHLSRSYCYGEYATEPDGFCAWGERRES